MPKKILIVEDEEGLAEGIRLNLEAEGFTVDWARDGSEGLRKALVDPPNSPDLLILDIMLPGKNGLDVCRELRRRSITTPIIMLTAKGEEIDKVLGLELGADDYMTKPFSIRELLARIKVQLRREEARPPQVPREPAPLKSFRLGDTELDFVRFKVRRGGREQNLTSMEVEILRYLIEHRGEVVTRDALLDKIWGYEKFPTTRTVDSHILKLRKKIEPDPANPRHILSVYGEGYRFIDES
jgi:DNA-binding response OmpR family regulator